MANAEGRDDEQLPEEHQEPMNDATRYFFLLVQMVVNLHAHLEILIRRVNRLQPKVEILELVRYT